ncbi:hypothetical protein ABPG74_015802 [Tetrahymena malaccensis]
MSNTEDKIILGYWDYRGRPQPLKFLLEYMGIPFEQKYYSYDNPDEWYEKDKKTIKPFSNLPYLQTKDGVLTETCSIIKYLLKRFPQFKELLGKEQDEIFVDQMLSVMNDLRDVLKALHFNPDVHKVKRDTLLTILPKMLDFKDIRGDKQFLLPYLTIADFEFVEILLLFKHLDSELFDQHLSSFEKFLQDFHNLPRIKEYVSSEKYQKLLTFFAKPKAYLQSDKFIIEYNKQFLQKNTKL